MSATVHHIDVVPVGDRTQDGFQVASLVEAALLEIKRQFPAVTTCDVQSDNASNLSSCLLYTYYRLMAHHTGIAVVRAARRDGLPWVWSLREPAAPQHVTAHRECCSSQLRVSNNEPHCGKGELRPVAGWGLWYPSLRTLTVCAPLPVG